MRAWVALVGVAVSAVVSVAGPAPAPASSTGSPAGLTKAGWTLWQFEALLHDTFPHASKISAHFHRTDWWNFACPGACAPLAYWQPYSFTFSGARHSRFHLSAKRGRPLFGNYPIPIKIKGRLVACDRRERNFLITYGDAVGLSLACLRPGRPL